MKITKNILKALVALPLVAGLASCEKMAEYTPAEALSNAQVYFPTTMEKTIELTTDRSTVSCPINRIKTDGELTVPLKYTSTNDKITASTSAKFADKENVGTITISYDPEAVVAGQYDTLTITIDNDEYTTVYGDKSVTLLVGQAEPWISLGKGQFYDEFWDEDNYYDVEIEQYQLKPNHYRVVDPYKDMLGYAKRDAYLYFTVYAEGEAVSSSYNAPFDGFVFYEPINSGYYYGDGYGYVMAYSPWYFSSFRANDDIMALQRVAGYKADGTPGLISLTAYYYLPDYGGGWNYTTDDGCIQIVMPDYKLSDYSTSVSYSGKFIDTDENTHIVTWATFGADVADAKIAIIAGKPSDEGLAEAEETGMKVDVVNGEIRVDFPSDAQTGNYTIYLLAYDAEGNLVNYATYTFKYTAAGQAEETWSPRYVGTWTYSLYAFCNEDGTPYDHEGLILYQSDQDSNNWMIENLWYGVSFYFTWDQSTNTIEFEDQFTGANYGYGDIFAVDMTVYDYDPSYFDTSTNSFMFDIYYVDDQYSWGYGWEKFHLTGTADAAKARAMKKAVANKKNFKSKKTPLKKVLKLKNAPKKMAF